MAALAAESLFDFVRVRGTMERRTRCTKQRRLRTPRPWTYAFSMHWIKKN